MSTSSGSSGRGMDIDNEISLEEPLENVDDNFTDEQLALIEETLDLVMLKNFGCLLDDEGNESVPEFCDKLPEGASSQDTEKSHTILKVTRLSEQKQQALVVSVKEVQEKICRCLFDIQSHIRRCVTFSDDEEADERRRRRRFEEFSTRLSRNYMYQVSCLITEIESSHRKKLLNKANQLFSAIHHALRFYCQNMGNFTNKMQQKKLLEMIQIISRALKVCHRKGIFSEDDELVDRMREMILDVFRHCDEFCETFEAQKAPKIVQKTVKCAPRKIVSAKNSLAMYLPQQQTPKKATTPTFHLNLEESDDEAPEGISRDSSTEHLDAVTTEDRLKLMEEQPQPTTFNSQPRIHPSVSIPNYDDFRYKSRELHRKDRAPSHASSSMKTTEGQDKLSFGQKKIKSKKKRPKRNLDGAYSEIGKEIVDMVGDQNIETILQAIVDNKHKEQANRPQELLEKLKVLLNEFL